MVEGLTSTTKREIGYWWVSRLGAEEVVYWTGSEVQIFGSDATLSEREVTWLEPIEKPVRDDSGAAVPDLAPPCPPKVAEIFEKALGEDYRRLLPKGAAFMNSDVDVAVVVYASSKRTLDESREAFWDWLERIAGVVRHAHHPTPLDERVLPPGFEIHTDHEESDFQAWLKPWGGTWTSDPSVATINAWQHLRVLAKPLLDQALAEVEHWRVKAERAGRYLTEVVNESNAAVAAAERAAYAAMARHLWPKEEHTGKTKDDVLARLAEIERIMAEDVEARLGLSRKLALAEGAIESAVAAARAAWVDEHSITVKAMLDHVTGMLVAAKAEGYRDGSRDAADAVRHALMAYTTDSRSPNDPLLERAARIAEHPRHETDDVDRE